MRDQLADTFPIMRNLLWQPHPQPPFYPCPGPEPTTYNSYCQLHLIVALIFRNVQDAYTITAASLGSLKLLSKADSFAPHQPTSVTFPYIANYDTAIYIDAVPIDPGQLCP